MCPIQFHFFFILSDLLDSVLKNNGIEEALYFVLNGKCIRQMFTCMDLGFM